MDYYQPPKNIPIPIQLDLFKFANSWPLSKNARISAKFLNIIIMIIILIFYMILIDAFYNFLTTKYATVDIVISLDCILTFITMVQVPVRFLHMYFYQKETREFMVKFYDEIYVHTDAPSKSYVERLMKPVRITSASYIVAITFFTTVPMIRKYFIGLSDPYPFPFKILYRFDTDNALGYLFGYLVGTFCGLVVAVYAVAETFIIEYVICHMMGQFSDLKNGIESLCIDKDENGKNIELGYEPLRFKLKIVLEKHASLMKFAKEFNTIFSFRYFVLLMCATIVMCLVVFQVSNLGFRVDLIKFVFWFVGATSEQLVLGYYASELIEVSNSVSTMFYLSHWEDIMVNDKLNPRQKIILMKDILTAMCLTANKPVKISGLGFFDLSFVTSMNTIRTSVSYFMFLNTMKDVKKP